MWLPVKIAHSVKNGGDNRVFVIASGSIVLEKYNTAQANRAYPSREAEIQLGAGCTRAAAAISP